MHRLPTRARLRTNACPSVLSYEETPEYLRIRSPDILKLRSRASCIRNDDALVQRLTTAFLATRKPKAPSPHVEEQIYDGFTSDEDMERMEEFHSTAWSKRPNVLSDFSDNRLKILGERLLLTEAPEVMPAPIRTAHDVEVAQRLLAEEGTVPWMTLHKAIIETDDILAAAVKSKVVVLRDLRDYLAQKVKAAGTLIA